MNDKKQCFRKEMKRGFDAIIKMMGVFFKFILSFLIITFPLFIILWVGVAIFPPKIIVNTIPFLIFMVIGSFVGVFYVICIGMPILSCYIYLSKTSSFENEIYCPQCGKKTDGNGTYCGWCGSNMQYIIYGDKNDAI